MDAIFGTWKNKKGTENNFDAFMEACKVPKEASEMFKNREYEVTYAKGDGENKMRVHMKVKDGPNTKEKTYDFELGKRFETTDVDGQELKGTVNWDGSKFVESYEGKKGINMEVTREIAGGVMKLTMTCHGVSAFHDWVKC